MSVFILPNPDKPELTIEYLRTKKALKKRESNFIATSRRTLRCVGYEPEARAGLNP
jgi:hypothetical protein